ncbi:hypothetical protein Pmani_035733 [Petrolisthes manimaculis]|uniref:Uncharacterized protein n=1 Tax=Petrolisthes manimaculis TaxID=1843537 RepID=A0AAE1TQ61_9EUCA|nr:hypothetical protein Pmani_038459 [Petrolisthes manimaculis]KAK4291439.1 hypothetical protein Pmani_035733 [Petrolisthes manimaculis]
MSLVLEAATPTTTTTTSQPQPPPNTTTTTSQPSPPPPPPPQPQHTNKVQQQQQQQQQQHDCGDLITLWSACPEGVFDPNPGCQQGPVALDKDQCIQTHPGHHKSSLVWSGLVALTPWAT